VLKDFYLQNKDLLEEINNWYSYLGNNFIKAASIKIKDKNYINNRSNMSLEITQFLNRKNKLSAKGKRKIASHLLQGQEAQFISRLTWYSEKYEDCAYTVMSDQHDGLIVEGYIPEEYVQLARDETDFAEAYLVEKPFR
jgi:hypothetical protein